MNIEFSSHRLQEASVSMAEAGRRFGEAIGRKYIQRVAVLKAVEKFSELYGHRALGLHPLKGDRAGEYAVILTGNFRLIVERVKEDTVRIKDVEDYHGD